MVRRFGNSGQYKIQQMAFMILAIFFFFILVGIFFIGWQYASMKQSFASLQEEKALSALKVIADSTELNCDASEDWCIDKDKLIAFGENSGLYRDFWSVASIEVLMVFPPRGERLEGSSDWSGSSVETVIDCEGGDTDRDGDGFTDRQVSPIGIEYYVNSRQGLFEHLSPNGDAQRPLVAMDNLHAGERVRIDDISGAVDYVGTEIGCTMSSSGGGYGLVAAGFYSANDELLLEKALVDFSVSDGVVVPVGADKLYVYIKESEEYKTDYSDNTGGCSFSVKKVGWEKCYSSDSAAGSAMSSGGVVFPGDYEPILCPQKNCDYYILYDSGQRNRRTYSAYVNVCETIDKSHEICELAKLMLGVKISENP